MSNKAKYRTFAFVAAERSIGDNLGHRELNTRPPIPFFSLGSPLDGKGNSFSAGLAADTKDQTVAEKYDKESNGHKKKQAVGPGSMKDLRQVDIQKAVDTRALGEGEQDRPKEAGAAGSNISKYENASWAMKAAKNAPKRLPLPTAWQKVEDARKDISDVEPVTQEIANAKDIQTEMSKGMENENNTSKSFRRHRPTLSQGPSLETERRAAQRELKRASSPEKIDQAPKLGHKKTTSMDTTKKSALIKSSLDTKRGTYQPIKREHAQDDWQLVAKKTSPTKNIESIKENTYTKSPTKRTRKCADLSIESKRLDSSAARTTKEVSPLKIPSAMFEHPKSKSPISGQTTYAAVTSGRFSAPLLEQEVAGGSSAATGNQDVSRNKIGAKMSADFKNNVDTVGDIVEKPKVDEQMSSSAIQNTKHAARNLATAVPVVKRSNHEGDMIRGNGNDSNNVKNSHLLAKSKKDQLRSAIEEILGKVPETPRRSRRLAHLGTEFQAEVEDVKLPRDELTPIPPRGSLVLEETRHLLHHSGEKTQRRSTSMKDVPPPKIALNLSNEVDIMERIVQTTNTMLDRQRRPLVGGDIGLVGGLSQNARPSSDRNGVTRSERRQERVAPRPYDSFNPFHNGRASQMPANPRPFEAYQPSRLNPMASEFKFGPGNPVGASGYQNYLQAYPVQDEVNLSSPMLRQPHRFGHPTGPVTMEMIVALEKSVAKLRGNVQDTYRSQYQHYRSGLVAENPHLYYQPAQLDLMFAPPLERPPLGPMSSYEDRWDSVQSAMTPGMVLASAPPIQMQIKRMDNISKTPGSAFYGVNYQRRKALSDSRLYGQSTFQYLGSLPVEGEHVTDPSKNVWEGLDSSIRMAIDRMEHHEHQAFVDGRTTRIGFGYQNAEDDQAQGTSHKRLKSLSGDRPRGFPKDESWQYHEQISMAERHAEHKPPQFKESTTLDKFERLRLAYGMRYDGRVTHKILDKDTPFEKTTLGEFLEQGAPVDFDWKKRRAMSDSEKLTKLGEATNVDKSKVSIASTNDSEKRTVFSSTPLGSILSEIEGADEIVVPDIFYSTKEHDALEENIPFWTQLREARIAKEVIARTRGKDVFKDTVELRRRSASDTLLEDAAYSRDHQIRKELIDWE